MGDRIAAALAVIGIFFFGLGIIKLSLFYSDYKDCSNLLAKMSVCHNDTLESDEYSKALDYCLDNRHDAAFMRQARRYIQVDCGKFWYGLGPHPKD